MDVVFGYPGGAVLPIYDEVFQQNDIRHILVRHEQGAVHAAEGYARSTGKPGVVLVTSGPGATNAVTGLTDALMDSIPLVVLTGQVPTFMIGNDAFQEADTVGITRPCTKHNWLVSSDTKRNCRARCIRRSTWPPRAAPVRFLWTFPRTCSSPAPTYTPPQKATNTDHYQPQVKGDMEEITELVAALEKAKRPVFYTGGGVINSGPRQPASARTGRCHRRTDHLDPDGSRRLSGQSGKNWIGMLGMHGLYEANMAMHDCDLMINIGARFDDRITGRVDAFSPGSKKAHIDIDPSSINKVIRTDIPIVGDVAHVLEDILKVWKSRGRKVNREGFRNGGPDRGLEEGRLPGLSRRPARPSSRSTRWRVSRR